MLLNTATVRPPLGATDPVPGDNSATDTNPTGAQADLSISKVEQSQSLYAWDAADLHGGGGQRRATNVVNARVQDALPAVLTDFSWTCTASGWVPHAAPRRALATSMCW